MDRYQYLLLMGSCVAITLPLEVLFRARVWRRPRRLAVALAPAMAIFVAWDLWATASGTWGFSDDYTIGVDLPGGMAVEELVFFTVIPVCGLLTLEAVRRILRLWDATDGPTSARLAATVRASVRTDGRLAAPEPTPAEGPSTVEEPGTSRTAPTAGGVGGASLGARTGSRRTGSATRSR